jgi:hypothetical protein
MAQYENLINGNYFQGEIAIAGLQSQEVIDELNLFITKYELEFLTKLLGRTLYEAFYLAMQEPVIESRFVPFAYGKYFEFVSGDSLCDYVSRGDCMVNYKGLLQNPDSDLTGTFLSQGYLSNSPIANYIYWHWNLAHESTIGTATESKQQVSNGLAIGNGVKSVRAWNEMCDQVFDFYKFIDMNIADYPEFDLKCEYRFYPLKTNIMGL